MFFVPLLIVMVLLFWKLYVWPISHFKRMGIKQFDPWPIFGDRWRTEFGITSFPDLLKMIYNKYSNASSEEDNREVAETLTRWIRPSPFPRYMGYYFYSSPALMIKDPELIKNITVQHFDSFADRIPQIDPDADVLWGHTLLLAKGKKWKELRTLLSASYTSSKMKQIFGVIVAATESFVQYYLGINEDVIEVDIYEKAERLSIDLIATTAFGLQVDSLREPNNDFYIIGRNLADLTTFRSKLVQLVTHVFPFILRVFKVPLFDRGNTSYFGSIIHKTLALREKQNIFRPDLINIMLETRRTGGQVQANENTDKSGYAATTEYLETSKEKKQRLLTDIEIESQATVVFLAGFSSTSISIAFACFELALDQDVQDRLRKEIIETAKKNNDILSYESLMEMKYLDMVTSETLRKWPALVSFDRVCTKPFTIEPSQQGEKPIDVRVGDNIFIPVMALQWDPRYFPRPEKFDPERFAEENLHKITPYTYIPFGAGPRNCIASRLALLEIKVCLYLFVKNFKLVATKKTFKDVELGLNWFFLYPKNGLPIGFEKLKN